MIIKPITDNNPKIAFAIYGKAMRDAIEAVRGELYDEDREYKQFCEQWQAETSYWILHNHKRVGFLDLRPKSQSLYIHNLAIHPTYQNQGIGSHLISQLKQMAKDQKATLTLSVFKTNQLAQNFYKRHGFCTTHQTKHHLHQEWIPDAVDS